MSFNNLFILGVIIFFSPQIGKLIKSSYDYYTLYQKSKKGNKLIDLLYRLTPREFEIWCSEYLSSLGYKNIILSPLGPDGGKDIICIKDNKTYYVECKRYFKDNYVTSKEVEKLLGTLISNNVYNGVLITTGSLSSDAKDFVENLPLNYNIELISFAHINKYYYEYLNELN